MKKVLEIQNLNILLLKDKKGIVKEVCFDVKEGSILGLIGESGSGKTLLCKAIMGLLNPKTFIVKGKVLYKDIDIISLEQKKLQSLMGRELSLIMQNPMTAFDPSSKIGSQITETLRVHFKISKKMAYEQAITHLKNMNLGREEEIMESYPHELSGGMLQRIMIAIAIMLDSKLIIADEITTAVDANNRILIIEEFKKLQARNRAIIFVTHDFNVLSELAKEIVVMKDGEILERGSIYDVLENPKEEYTRELIAASNLMEELL